MEKLLNLMTEKNHYLEKFYSLNAEELVNFGDGNYENVESFYRARDKILDLIRTIDEMIDAESKTTALPLTTGSKADVEKLLTQKDEWVTAILSQDLQVLSWIEKEKSKIIKELQVVGKAKKAVAGYHSGTRPVSKFDEEA
jgi:hypothetical protein